MSLDLFYRIFYHLLDSVIKIWVWLQCQFYDHYQTYDISKLVIGFRYDIWLLELHNSWDFLFFNNAAWPYINQFWCKEYVFYLCWNDNIFYFELNWTPQHAIQLYQESQKENSISVYLSSVQ